MDELFKRIARWGQGKTEPPYTVQLHLTNNCNLSCGFCPTVSLKNENEVDYSEELSREKWIDLVEEGERLGVEEWHICGGGEPLIDKELALDLMERIKSYGARGELVTNGTLIDDRTAKKIVKMNWDHVSVSIDGPDKETNDGIRSQGSFEKAVNGAENLSRYRKGDGPQPLPSLLFLTSTVFDFTLKPNLAVETVLCSENHDKVVDMVRLTSDIGFDEIRFNTLNIWNEVGEKLAMDISEVHTLKKELKKAGEVAKEVGVGMSVADNFKAEDLKENIDTAREMGRLVGLLNSLGGENG